MRSPGHSSPLLLAALLFACEYVPPPSVVLVAPEQGTFESGDPVQLRFDQPIEAATLAVSIWPDERTVENELPASSKAHVSNCRPTKSPCGDLNLELSKDRKTATLTFDPEGLGRPDVPLLLEVAAGLKGSEGAETGTNVFFDFQFRPVEANVEGLTFEEGTYIIVGVVEQPVPAVLTLITDIRTRADGRVVMVAAEGDEVEGEPKNTHDPTKLFVDDTDMGFALFVGAQLRVAEDTGERFLESDPFQVVLALGSVNLTIHETRLTGKIIEVEGHDQIEGTMSFSSVELANGVSEPFSFPAGSTTITGIWVAPEDIPENSPTVCGDQCGAVTAQCEPPEGFNEGFCD